MVRSGLQRIRKYRAKLDPNVVYSRFKFGKFSFTNNYDQKAKLQYIHDKIIEIILDDTGVSRPFQSRLVNSTRDMIKDLYDFSGATLQIEFNIKWRDFLLRNKLNLTEKTLEELQKLTDVDLEAEVDDEHILAIPVEDLKDDIWNALRTVFLNLSVISEYLLSALGVTIVVYPTSDYNVCLMSPVSMTSETMSSFYNLSALGINLVGMPTTTYLVLSYLGTITLVVTFISSYQINELDSESPNVAQPTSNFSMSEA